MTNNINPNLTHTIQNLLSKGKGNEIQVESVTTKWGRFKVTLKINNKTYEMSANKFKDLALATASDQGNALYGKVSTLEFKYSGHRTPEQKIEDRIKNSSLNENTNSLMKTAGKIKYGIKKIALALNFKSGEISKPSQRSKLMQALPPKDVFKSMVTDFNKGACWNEAPDEMIEYISSAYNRGNAEVKNLAVNALSNLYDAAIGLKSPSAKQACDCMKTLLADHNLDSVADSLKNAPANSLVCNAATEVFFEKVMNGDERAVELTTKMEPELATKLLSGATAAIRNTTDNTQQEFILSGLDKVMGNLSDQNIKDDYQNRINSLKNGIAGTEVQNGGESPQRPHAEPNASAIAGGPQSTPPFLAPEDMPDASPPSQIATSQAEIATDPARTEKEIEAPPAPASEKQSPFLVHGDMPDVSLQSQIATRQAEIAKDLARLEKEIESPPAPASEKQSPLLEPGDMPDASLPSQIATSQAEIAKDPARTEKEIEAPPAPASEKPPPEEMQSRPARQPEAPPKTAPSPKPVPSNTLPNPQQNFSLGQKASEITQALRMPTMTSASQPKTAPKPHSTSQEIDKLEQKINSLRDDVYSYQVRMPSVTPGKFFQRDMRVLNNKIAALQNQIATLEAKKKEHEHLKNGGLPSTPSPGTLKQNPTQSGPLKAEEVISKISNSIDPHLMSRQLSEGLMENFKNMKALEDEAAGNPGKYFLRINSDFANGRRGLDSLLTITIGANKTSDRPEGIQKFVIGYTAGKGFNINGITDKPHPDLATLLQSMGLQGAPLGDDRSSTSIQDTPL